MKSLCRFLIIGSQMLPTHFRMTEPITFLFLGFLNFDFILFGLKNACKSESSKGKGNICCSTQH